MAVCGIENRYFITCLRIALISGKPYLARVFVV